MNEDRTVRLSLNGEDRAAVVDNRTLLVHAIRNDFGLTGTHVGCLTGDCGACTIALDGRIVKSCLMLAISADGSAITTIEGFGAAGALDVIQEAFWDEYGFQCGYCLPGMLFATRDLLERTLEPTEAEARAAVDGNLCRCTGYENIVASVMTAAQRLRSLRRDA